MPASTLRPLRQPGYAVALILSVLASAACGQGGNDADDLVCEEIAQGDFDARTGWESASYCDEPTDLGCFPYFGSTEDTCGPFDTMRTSATSDAQAQACATLLETLNCGTYADDAGNSLSFHVDAAERFSLRAVGELASVGEVDTILYFNPCHQNCLAAITLDTLAPEQQKICEIPRQGKPVCLFPETAHALTFARAGSDSVVLRMAGEETVLVRQE